jgi:hypothetical protein
MQEVRWINASLALVTTAAIAMSLGCTQKPAVAVPAINDKVYAVTPDSLKVKAGIVTGAVTEMAVKERVEEGSGRVTTPAKLSGKLVLKNVSTDQTVRLVSARVIYIDAQGKPIVLEENRNDQLLKLVSGYNSGAERLDPGQETTHALDFEFPAAALKAKRLKDIRLDIVYLPSSYKEESLNLPVSIGAGKDPGAKSP